MTYLSETSKLYLRIDPRRIVYLKFLLEGYDGLAILSTIDAHAGLVLIRYPGDVQAVLFELLADLAADLTRQP
ncbi:MAG: DUF4911 domain-containing protein [Desulfurivibrio sp.]|nr:MAG: DUF4911 domain-containing protein [Desulfurivibrio sp.]